jgi:type IV secretion system protein TrbL
MGGELMACAEMDWGCRIGNLPGDWIKGTAGQTIQALADAISQSAGQTLSALGSFWVALPTPDLVGGDRQVVATAPPSEEFETLLSWCIWISLAICILSLFAVGARLVIRPRDAAGSVSRLGIVLGAVVLVSAAVSIISAVMQNQPPANVSSPVAFIQSSLTFYVGGMAIFGVVIGAGRMAWNQRMAPGRDLLQSLLTLTVVSGSGLVAIQLAVVAADGLAAWVLSSSTVGTDFGQNMISLVLLPAGQGGTLGPILVIVLGVIALLASLVQIALMVIRGAMLVLLAGIFPLSASFTNTNTGKAWFQKCVSWLIAFLLYKPAAAVVYATAFQLAGGEQTPDATGLLKIVTGVVMMVMALVALPALMKFIAPMVSQTGSGDAAIALAAAGGGAIGEIATGAIKRASLRGNGGGGSESSIPEPSGSKTPSSEAASVSGSPMPSAATATGGGSASAAGSGAAASGSAATASSAAAAGGGAAAAAGPVGIAVVAAQKVGEAGKKGADAMKGAAEDAAGGGPTGS